MNSSPGGDPGALTVRGLAGTAVVAAAEYARLPFGRRPGEGGVLVGEDDQRVSREHGALTHRGGWWWLSNSGHTPIEFSPTRQLHADDEPEPLAPGYTTLLVVGSAGRKHPLEVHITAPDHDRPVPVTGPTLPGRRWELTDTQRLVLTALGQQYLRGASAPQPMSRAHVAELMTTLDPAGDWNVRRVDRVVDGVRDELSARGVQGLTSDEVPQPIGNSLKHNLLTELAITTRTLTRADLDALDSLDRLE